jgi:alpha-pyrone synthase
MQKLNPAIWSIGTALPAYRISQEQALRFMLSCYPEDVSTKRRLHYVYRRSHIHFRFTCCADFTLDPAAKLARGDLYLLGEPGTGQRMRAYEERVGELVVSAARQAFSRQEVFKPEDITHLIAVTCTGFCAPGADLELVEQLGLRRDIRRLQIGFMGCQAALQALQTADSICRADPEAVVLLVCAELCTLHFQRQPTQENLIINSLFADGAAAALVSASTRGEATALCHLDRFASHLVPDTRDLVSWHIGDQGFRMGLSLETPAAVRRVLPEFVDGLVEGAGLQREAIDFWVIHPGGRAILDAAEKALALEPRALEAAREVLRMYGNMSSPTVLFVLERVLRQARDGQVGLALSFGPGLNLEGLLWRKGAGHG